MSKNKMIKIFDTTLRDGEQSPGASMNIEEKLRIASQHQGVVREGDPGEVLIPLTLPEGRSTLTLEYRW